MADTHTYSKKEEIANAITYGIGSLMSVAALVLLIVFAVLHGKAWHVVTFTIYGTTMQLHFFAALIYVLPW